MFCTVCDMLKYIQIASLKSFLCCRKYEKLFDVVYFSNAMVHHLVPPISNIMADKSVVVLETAKFITELTREQYVGFANKIDGMAKAVGCETMIDCNPQDDCFAFYKYERHKGSS